MKPNRNGQILVLGTSQRVYKIYLLTELHVIKARTWDFVSAPVYILKSLKAALENPDKELAPPTTSLVFSSFFTSFWNSLDAADRFPLM